MLVVITVAILSMLGTALLSMSLMNINMKQNDYRIKKTAYYAESGIDQVYARVGKLVERAIVYAMSETDAETINILEEINTMLETTPPTADTARWSLYGQYVYENDAGNYMLDKEALELETRRIYKNKFRAYLNLENTAGRVLPFLDGTEKAYVNLDSDDPGNSSSIVIELNAGDITNFVLKGSHYEFVIRNFKSTFIHRDKTVKVITTDIIITDEIASYPLNTIEKRMIIPDNPLWQQAIVAHKNIIFDGNAVEVNGDMYGYGTIPANTADPTGFGGVIAKRSTVTVNGNIYSRSYVQLGKDSHANLTVNNGRIYANSVVVQKGATGRMTINGSVYTSDDLELNGTGAKLIINGSYYGYTTNATTGLTHDASSAIVINEDMSVAGSKLTITGVDNPTIAGAHPEETAGILVGGTAYVDSKPTRYQTAESVSFKGNFVAYTWGFPQQVLTDHIYKPGVFVSGKYNFYSTEASRNTQVDANLLKEHVAWQGITGSTVRLANGTTVVGVNSTLNDRKAYFTAFKEYVDTSGAFIKTGNGQVDLNNYIYTTGLKLAGNDFANGTGAQEVFGRLSPKITKDYLFQLHKLKYRNNINVAHIEKIPSGGVGVAPTVENINIIEKYSALAKRVTPYNSVTASVESIISHGNQATEVKHISNSITALHIYANGEAGNLLPNIRGSKLQGVIIHQGDIIIHGAVEFVGTMISGGTITTHGGPQKFYNNSKKITEYLAKLIYEDDQLYAVFNVKTHGDNGIVPVNLDTIEFVEIVSDQSTSDPNNNSIYDYNDLISFEHWHVSK